jgi:glycerophosphoryl diester phosphodiesterase
VRKIIAIILLVSIIPLNNALALDNNGQWTEHEVIAHAMGGIQGKTYTNSYEAFIANYEKGVRVFEVDLQLTEDGYLVARHDWDNVNLYEIYEQTPPAGKAGLPLTLKEFLSLKINKNFTPLHFGDIVGLMMKYPDIYIVTDTKDVDARIIFMQFQKLVNKAISIDEKVLKRIVPQIYHYEMFEVLEELYPFPSYIFTLYATREPDENIIDFISRTPKIDAVTMNEYRVNDNLVEEINRLGIKSYVHTINDFSVYQNYKTLGLFGIYSDFLNPLIIELEKTKQQLENLQL